MRVDTAFYKVVSDSDTDGLRARLSTHAMAGIDTRLLLFLVLCVTLALTACSPKAAQALKDEPVVSPAAVEKVEVSNLDGRSLLTIVTTTPLRGKYTLLKLPDPPKLIIEMPDVEPGKFSGPIQIGDGTIDRIDISNIKGVGLRFEIGLLSPVEYLVKADNNRLEVYFAQAPPVEEAPLVKALAEAQTEKTQQGKNLDERPIEVVKEEVMPVETAAQPESVVPEEVKPVEMTAPAAAVQTQVEKKVESVDKTDKAAKDLKLKDVRIKQAGRVTTAEIVTDGDPWDYKVFDLASPSRVVVDILNAREIVAKRKIKVSTTHIKGARVGRYDGKVRVVFDYKGNIKPYEVVKGEDRIVISFGTKPVEPEKKESGIKPPVAKKDAGPIKEEKAETVPVAQPPAEVVKVTQAGESQKKTPDTKKAEKSAKVEEVAAESPAVQLAVQPSDTKSVTENKIEHPAETRPETKEEHKETVLAAEKVQPVVESKHEIEIKQSAVRGEPSRTYTGQKVTLEFKDADIKNIFRVIAEVSGYNMIIDNAVSGKVTLRLVNVPWDQALDLILETNNLGMTKVGNVIRVLPLAVIKKEEDEKMASKQAKEKLEDLVTKLIPVSYAKASDLKTRLKGVMSDRGTAEVDDRTNTIILKDTQKSVDASVQLVASLDTPTPQVMIEARIVTANTNFSRDLGVQWGAGYSADAAHGNPTGYYFPNSYNVTGGGGGSFSLNPPTAGGVGPNGGAIGISFGSINNTLNLDLRLSALEKQGWGKIVSSPKIITLDNKEASIQQGFSVPYETTSASGTQTQFVDASLNLTVTPHVTADGRLMMKIKATKNAPSDAFKSVGGVPSIDKKETTTEILVKDGDTTVIGGIYEITKGESETYTPFLGKIPVIGWLFKSKSNTETKSELLIFITPRILQDKPV